MDHQPARAFRNPHPHHEHDEAEAGAGEIGEPPAEIRTDQRRIEQHDRAGGADRRADPEAAVDHEIGPAAIARRHQFLDRRIDRGVFAADPGTGQEAKQRITSDTPRQRRRGGRGEIDRERDEEQFLAPDPVGQPAETERAEHGAGEIGAVGKSDIEIRKAKRRAFLQRAGQRAGQRDFQPVENPGDPERQHDAGMKSAPAQIIEPRRNAGLDDAVIVLPASGAETDASFFTAEPCRISCTSIGIEPMRKRLGTPSPKVLWPEFAANMMPATR